QTVSRELMSRGVELEQFDGATFVEVPDLVRRHAVASGYVLPRSGDSRSWSARRAAHVHLPGERVSASGKSPDRTRPPGADATPTSRSNRRLVDACHRNSCARCVSAPPSNSLNRRPTTEIDAP